MADSGETQTLSSLPLDNGEIAAEDDTANANDLPEYSDNFEMNLDILYYLQIYICFSFSLFHYKPLHNFLTLKPYKLYPHLQSWFDLVDSSVENKVSTKSNFTAYIIKWPKIEIEDMIGF